MFFFVGGGFGGYWGCVLFGGFLQLKPEKNLYQNSDAHFNSEMNIWAICGGEILDFPGEKFFAEENPGEIKPT